MGLKGSIVTNPKYVIEHKDSETGEILVKIHLEGTDPLSEGYVEQPKWVSYTEEEKKDIEHIEREMQKNFVEHLARVFSFCIKKVEGLEEYEVDGKKFKLEFADDEKKEVSRGSVAALLRICEVEGIDLTSNTVNFYNDKKKFKNITVDDKKKES